MNQIGRRFALSDTRGSGIWCGESGVFIGDVPLLEQVCSSTESDQWQPRLASDLNRDLAKRYGVPVEFDSKVAGLATIARSPQPR